MLKDAQVYFEGSAAELKASTDPLLEHISPDGSHLSSRERRGSGRGGRAGSCHRLESAAAFRAPGSCSRTRSITLDSTAASESDASMRHHPIWPVSWACCMRTTSASASDGSLRRCSVRVDQHGLWRLEPQPDERHRGGLGDAVRWPRRSAARAYTASTTTLWPRTEDQCGALCQGGVHALGHLRRVSLRTKALQERDTAQTLPRLVAAQDHRTRDGADEWRETERERRLSGARETSDRHEAWTRRMQELFGHGEILARHARELAAALRVLLKLRRRRARLGANSRPAGQKQRQQRDAVEVGRLEPGSGSTRRWHDAAVFAARDPSGETRDRRGRRCRKSRR